MAIIYSFPEGTPTLSDTVLGTQFDSNGNPTKSFSISDIVALVNIPSVAGLVPYTGATQSVNLGAYNLTAISIIKAGGTSAQYLMADGSISTAPSLTGLVPYVGATQNVNLGSFNLTATSIVKAGGTNLQFLMADGSVTTSGPLFKAASITTSTGVVSVISSAILGNIFTNGSILKIQTMVSFPNQTLNITPITYYINTTPSIVGATQIATFDIPVGQRYSWMDRSFWSIGGTFNSRNFGNSSQTSVSNSGSALGSTSIPATFYIIASMNVGVGDTGTIASILIEKQ